MKARPILRGGLGREAAPPHPGAAPPGGERRYFTTARFGRIGYDPSKVIWCEWPLCHEHPRDNRWLLLPSSQWPKLMWLQSVETPDCSMLLTDPRQWHDEYRPRFLPELLHAIGLREGDDEAIEILCPVRGGPFSRERMADGTEPPVVINLARPLVINPDSRRMAPSSLPCWTTAYVIELGEAQSEGNN